MISASSKILAIVFTLVLVLSTLQVSVALGKQENAYKYLFIFYVPYIDHEAILNITNKYGLNSTKVKLYLDVKATPDYYLYWILSGKKPENTDISLLTSKVDQEKVVTLWSNVTLVDIPAINPENYTAAINPIFNIHKLHLTPVVMEVPINGTAYWSEIGITITSSLVGERLELKLEELNVTLVSPNITTTRILGPRAINIVKPEEKAGEYYIAFYVMGITEDSIKLFFPGALRTENYASPGISKIEGAISHWYLVFSYMDTAKVLTSDALEWWLNSTAVTTQIYLMRAITDTNSTIYFFYVPHIALARKILSSELLVRYQNYVCDLIVSMLTSFADVKKPDYLVVFLAVSDEESYAVFSSKKIEGGELAGFLDLTMSQFVGIMLSYSNVFPLKHSELFNLRLQVDNLEKEVESLRNSVNELNVTLSSTRDRLTTCESERELLQVKLLEVESLHKSAENLMNTAQLYLASGLIISVAISLLLGFLAFRVSAKKKAS